MTRTRWTATWRDRRGGRGAQGARSAAASRRVTRSPAPRPSRCGRSSRPPSTAPAHDRVRAPARRPSSVTGEARRQAEKDRTDAAARPTAPATRPRTPLVSRERAEAEASAHVSKVQEATSTCCAAPDRRDRPQRPGRRAAPHDRRRSWRACATNAGSLESGAAGHPGRPGRRRARPRGRSGRPSPSAAPPRRGGRRRGREPAEEEDAPRSPRSTRRREAAEEPRGASRVEEEADAAEERRPRAGTRGRAAQATASEGARLIALNMALNGTPRDETARYLEENFELEDQRHDPRRGLRPRQALSGRRRSEQTVRSESACVDSVM